MSDIVLTWFKDDADGGHCPKFILFLGDSLIDYENFTNTFLFNCGSCVNIIYSQEVELKQTKFNLSNDENLAGQSP